MSEIDQGNSAALKDDNEQKTRGPRKLGALKPCERCRSQHLKCVYTSSDRSSCQRCERTGHDCVRSTKKIKFRDVPASKFRNARKSPGNAPEKPGNKTIEFVDETSAAATKHAVSLHSQKQVKTTVAPVSSLDKTKDSSAQTELGARAELEDISAKQDPEDDGYTDLTGEPNRPFDFEQRALATDVEPEQSCSHNGDSERHYKLTHTTSDPLAPSSEDSLHFSAPSIPTLPDYADDRVSVLSAMEQNTLTRVLSGDRMSTFSFTSSPRRRTTGTSSGRCLDHMVKAPAAYAAYNSHKYTETVLLRYFHEELAPWFDLCDPDCHFATVVPRRARELGPLRSALLTISARNLSRNRRFRNEAGIVEWRGRQLPHVEEEFAMPYHNECIRDLLQLSLDPKKLQDENLLAAVILLRTDEELGLNMLEEEDDQQLFLRIGSLFVDAQLPISLSLPHSSPEVFHPIYGEDTMTHLHAPSPSTQTDDLGVSGLRQACFWTAFRQDLHAAFLHRRPVRFPLSRCETFRQLTPATDAVWTNRMVTFCADALEFVFGSDNVDGKVLPAYTNSERWRELRGFEERLCALLPASFEPTYCSEPDTSRGTIFPEIWFLESCHVSGTTYVELARMLLEVFNPTRPRLGYGFLAATNAFISRTKKILFRLCGIALSNQQYPPCLINACLSISMFGEYFEDPIEQDAILGVLGLMGERYAYPTSPIADSLKQAWTREDMDFDVPSFPSMHNIDTG